jgi:hypothetical protein
VVLHGDEHSDFHNVLRGFRPLFVAANAARSIDSIVPAEIPAS